MSNRYSNTERLGVIETDRIITKELCWIFREQPIIDVGIDAIIEEVINENPTSKFIAVQIKTGECNFHFSNNKIIHYVSQIHHDYWLNCNLPVILIAHLPEENKTYWQEINSLNFKKTQKRWKIEIPIQQELNIKAINKLSKIIDLFTANNSSFSESDYQNDEPKSISEYIENINCISESTSCIDRCSNILNDFSEKMNNYNSELIALQNSHIKPNSNDVNANIKGVARLLLVTSKKFESEIQIFSKLFSDGMFAYEQVVLNYYQLTNNIDVVKETIEKIKMIPFAVDFSIPAIQSLKISVLKNSKLSSHLKEPSKQFSETMDMVITEYSVAKEISEKIAKNFDEI